MSDRRFPGSALLECVALGCELRYRQRVYSRLEASGKMTRQKADEETEKMEQVLLVLEKALLVAEEFRNMDGDDLESLYASFPSLTDLVRLLNCVLPPDGQEGLFDNVP